MIYGFLIWPPHGHGGGEAKKVEELCSAERPRPKLGKLPLSDDFPSERKLHLGYGEFPAMCDCRSVLENCSFSGGAQQLRFARFAFISKSLAHSTTCQPPDIMFQS